MNAAKQGISVLTHPLYLQILPELIHNGTDSPLFLFHLLTTLLICAAAAAAAAPTAVMRPLQQSTSTSSQPYSTII